MEETGHRVDSSGENGVDEAFLVEVFVLFTGDVIGLWSLEVHLESFVVGFI